MLKILQWFCQFFMTAVTCFHKPTQEFQKKNQEVSYCLHCSPVTRLQDDVAIQMVRCEPLPEIHNPVKEKQSTTTKTQRTS